MARKIFLFLVIGVFVGALAGFAVTGFAEEPVLSFSEDSSMADSGFHAVGGVADYWPEDSPAYASEERGPVETGALPTMSEEAGSEVPTQEIGTLNFRPGIDDGP